MTAEPMVMGSWYETTEVRVDRVVVPRPPRSGYDPAVSVGAGLASPWLCPLHLLCIGDVPGPEIDALKADVQAAHPEVMVTAEAVTAGPSSASTMAGALRRSDLVIMSTEGGLDGGASFAQVLTDRWAGPVMMLGPGFAGNQVGSGGIAIALDGSALAERALPMTRYLAERLQAPLSAVEVVPAAVTSQVQRLVARGERVSESAYLIDLVARLDAAGVPATWTVVHDDEPVDGLMSFLHDHDISMLVMATHGRGGLPRPAFGSTCLAAVRRANVPVVVIRPTGPTHMLDVGSA